MAMNKSDLFALINSNLADNTSKAITPQKVREVSTQEVDSALNVAETSSQVVAGPVNFTGTLKKSGKDVLVGGSVGEVLRSASITAQNPTGLGAPLQIVFGAASGSGSTPVQISAAGLVTFNQSGKYAVRVKFQVGRTAGAGISHILTRMLKNGAQVGTPDISSIETANQIYTKESRVAIEVLAGDTIAFQVARDPSGNNSGGLAIFTPTGALSAWGVTASALLVIERFEGVVS